MKKSRLFLVSRPVLIVAAILIVIVSSATVFASQADYDVLCAPGVQCLISENEDNESGHDERGTYDSISAGAWPEILGTALPSDYSLQLEFRLFVPYLIVFSYLNRAPPL